MIRMLRHFFPGLSLRDVIKEGPTIKGHLRLELRERGKLKTTREGYNICTLTGREYFSEIQALAAWNPARAPFRSDRIAFIGMGTGAQPEVSNVQALTEPVPYNSGEFLAYLATPATFPVTGVDAARTAVQYIRDFGQGEISLGYDVVLTEAGLYTDGNPDDNNNTVGVPTDYDTANGRAPAFYKTFEPITKTTQFTLRAVWEVRIL